MAADPSIAPGSEVTLAETVEALKHKEAPSWAIDFINKFEEAGHCREPSKTKLVPVKGKYLGRKLGRSRPSKEVKKTSAEIIKDREKLKGHCSQIEVDFIRKSCTIYRDWQIWHDEGFSEDAWGVIYIEKLDAVFKEFIGPLGAHLINLSHELKVSIREKKGTDAAHEWKHNVGGKMEFYEPKDIFDKSIYHISGILKLGPMKHFKKRDLFKDWQKNYGEQYEKWKSERSASTASEQYNYFNDMIAMENEQDYYIGAGRDSYQHSPHQQFLGNLYDGNDRIYYNNNNIIIGEFILLSIMISLFIMIIILMVCCLGFIYCIKKTTKPTQRIKQQPFSSYSDYV